MSQTFRQWMEDGAGASAGGTGGAAPSGGCSSCGGGGTGTSDIAAFKQPVGRIQRRQFVDYLKNKLKKREGVDGEELVESKLPFTYMSMSDKMREQLIPKPDHEEFYEGKTSSSRKSSPVRRAAVPESSVACPACKKKVRKSKMVKVPDSLQEKYGAKTLCLECAKKKRENKKED